MIGIALKEEDNFKGMMSSFKGIKLNVMGSRLEVNEGGCGREGEDWV